MNTKINKFHYPDLQTAWEAINEYFLNNERQVRKSGGSTYGSEIVSYDNMIYIDKVKLAKDFNFGRKLGYTYKKWSKLVNNYVNFHYLDLVATEIRDREKKKSTNYNYTYHFDNSHGSGKDCLISLTFCRRKKQEHPIAIFNTRASEVTKRLIFDLLLLQRMIEYVYGRKNDVQLICYIPFMFLNLECSLMYVADKGVEIVSQKNGKYSHYQTRLLEKYNKFLTMDVEKIKYKVHLRAAKQVQRNKDGTPSSNVKDCFAKDLKLIPTKKIRAKDIEQLESLATI